MTDFDGPYINEEVKLAHQFFFFEFSNHWQDNHHSGSN